LWCWFKLIAAVELPLIGVNDEQKALLTVFEFKMTFVI